MHVRRSFLPVLLLLCAACVRNPATGKLELNLLPQGQEVSLGQDAKKQTEQSIGLYPDQKLQKYVADIGAQIAPLAKRDVPFSYEIVDDESVNAFALPGGPVFITRGILGYLNSEAELVAVLGHETGHVAARHSANQMSKQSIAQLGLGLGSILSPTVASIGQVAAAGMQVLFLKYSRDDETQADLLGFRYMGALGYDQHQMLALFDMLQGVTDQAGAGKLPEWTQTHPIPENRHANTEGWIKKPEAPIGNKVEREKYLRMIDGIVFGEDPRKGYFKGDLFVQPDMKLQLQFPAKWQHQNTADAVVGVSPEQDAMVQLQVVGKVSPEEAAQKIFAQGSQAGLQRGQPAQVDMHGMQNVATYFSAQSQQGNVDGLLVLVSKDGTCYGLLGYTKQGGMSKYDGTFKSWASSFGDIHDGSMTNVQPARLKLVQVSQPMPMSQFLQQYPSTAKPEVIALINGVKKDGTIQPGLAKQVVGGQGDAK